MRTSNEENWPVISLSVPLRIDVIAPPPLLDDESQERIEAIWQQTRKKHPTLYNGRIFCVTEMTPNVIVGFWGEYRWILAQMRDADLMSRLHVRSLAVTGVFECRDGFVFGRRRQNSVYLGGVWQGVPAGSVEARKPDALVDLQAQLLDELEEEIGLRDISHITGPLIACTHPSAPIIDLGFHVQTDLPFVEINDAWRRNGNDEYKQLLCIARSDLNTFNELLFPTTKALLDCLAIGENTNRSSHKS